jgi:CRISPR-associated protein Cmr2
MPPDWDFLLLTYLHDPPGKALGIPGHEDRAAELARIALDDGVDRSALHKHTRTEDILSSTLERVVPLPTAGQQGERAVGVEGGHLRVVHPLSAHQADLDVAALQQDPGAEGETLEAIVRGLNPVRARALAVWRLWRDRLAARHDDWARLPADTRLPDHTIWNHIDAAMGCAGSTGQQGVALLLFSLGPVQSFIASARTVRDLWAGSYLLSWLTFAAMHPILEECGPAAVLSPSFRGNPLMDRWLRRLRFEESPDAPCWLEPRIDEPGRDQLLSPCLPNRFSAFVPLGRDGETAESLALRCEEACKEAWEKVCRAVRAAFDGALEQNGVPHANGWDRLWDAQVGSFFEVRTAVLPLNECTDETLGRLLATAGSLQEVMPDAFAVRALEEAMAAEQRPGYHQDSAGRWMGALDLLGRLMAAQRALRPLPVYNPTPDSQGRWPGKCSLLGTYEQLGPAGRDEAGEFWKGAAALSIHGTRVRARERLCAVSLVKRYAWATYFTRELDLPADALRYPDSATVAAAHWLGEAKIDPQAHRNWSGQWLHWTQPNQDEDEERVPEQLWKRICEERGKKKPPAYYAILMLDGDHMGRWLRGAMAQPVRAVLHSHLVAYFRGLGGTEAGLDARRPFGPALHAALSEALTSFALHFVPAIVKKHAGTLIYAGGDDVLALLPTETALACAGELNCTYRQNWMKDEQECERLLMGERATASAGLAVVHYKEDLRVALQAAREAEKQAKSAGRDALCVRVVRRSGEDSSAVVGWGQVGTLQRLVEDFQAGTSDRWAYRLRAEMPTLMGLPEPAFLAEMTRLLDRLEAPSRDQRDAFRDRLLSFWHAYQQFRNEAGRNAEGARADLVTLCQSASFLARGRDQ